MLCIPESSPLPPYSLSLLLSENQMLCLKQINCKNKMGCTSSVYTTQRRKTKTNIPEVAIFSPSMRVPVQTDFLRSLKGLIPKDLAVKLRSLRNQIVLVAENTGGSAIADLQLALEEYLSILIGLTKKEYGLEGIVEFKWKNLDGGRQEICESNSWFELLCVIHMMAVLTLSEANSLLIPKYDTDSSQRIVSADCKREAVDLLLKASGLLKFCVRDILVQLPSDIKKRLPTDLQEGALEAISIQALGQGTDIQLGLAVESHKASLSVKRRLACEQLSYFGQAHSFLSACDIGHHGYGKKHLMFLKWKYIEAKAAAYYYHGLMLDKGAEPSCHVSAVCCFLAAEELLPNTKKACLSFCLSPPVTRIPPLWGAMKHLNLKIPEIASKKSQMYGYLLEGEKALLTLPDLPEFQLSLGPDDDYELPEIHPAWDSDKWGIPGQLPNEHLKETEDETEKKNDTIM